MSLVSRAIVLLVAAWAVTAVANPRTGVKSEPALKQASVEPAALAAFAVGLGGMALRRR